MLMVEVESSMSFLRCEIGDYQLGQVKARVMMESLCEWGS